MAETNIIELNGMRYDALTGKRLKGSPTPVSAPSKGRVDVAARVSAASKIDGFLHHQQSGHQEAKATSTKLVVKPISKIHVKDDSSPAPAPKRQSHYVTHHKVQSAATLMRAGLKKPHPLPKAIARLQPGSNIPSIAKSALMASAERRRQRAQLTKQSAHISHFNQHERALFHKRAAALNVRPAPKPQATRTATDSHHHSKASQETTYANHHKGQYQRAAQESPTRHPTTRKSPRHSHKPSARSLLTASAAALLITIFFAYQNLPNLQMHLAAARAGVHASLPGYLPSGFAFSGLSHRPGQVSVSFHSNSDSRSYRMVESKSSLDSQTPLSAVSAQANTTYYNLRVKGRDIYIYGQGNAVWESSGILYQISGNAGLSNSQIANIAASL